MNNANTNFNKVASDVGLNGGYTSIFVGSPVTALAWAEYVKSHNPTSLETARRGQEYIVSHSGVYVDEQAWRKAGRPSSR